MLTLSRGASLLTLSRGPSLLTLSRGPSLLTLSPKPSLLTLSPGPSMLTYTNKGCRRRLRPKFRPVSLLSTLPVRKPVCELIVCFFLFYKQHNTVHEISNNVVCATSKALDQPAHTRSLIRAFASRLSVLLLLSY